MGNLLVKDKKFYKSFFSLAAIVCAQSIITLGVNLADNVMLGRYSELAISGAALSRVSDISITFFIRPSSIPCRSRANPPFVISIYIPKTRMPISANRLDVRTAPPPFTLYSMRTGGENMPGRGKRAEKAHRKIRNIFLQFEPNVQKRPVYLASFCTMC